MIKISFSGISGSGKTSLLQEVKKILSLKYRVNSVDEINGRNPFDIDKRSSFVSQFYYFSTQMNEENIHALGMPDFLLCDRSVLDQWIYWKHHMVKKELTPRLEERDELLKHMYHFWIPTYHLVFFIRMDLKELDTREFDSEFRTTDLDYIKRTEELFLETIAEDHLNIFEIWNNNSIEESACQIIKIISEYKDSLVSPESPEKQGKRGGQ
ncbi:MAG TPA: AAA family ATPase [Candidatus Deferrimicrobium sp.]|nr:AAA family ATPase [Candidatus Deferrimicrobium sp.]